MQLSRLTRVEMSASNPWGQVFPGGDFIIETLRDDKAIKCLGLWVLGPRVAQVVLEQQQLSCGGVTEITQKSWALHRHAQSSAGPERTLRSAALSCVLLLSLRGARRSTPSESYCFYKAVIDSQPLLN